MGGGRVGGGEGWATRGRLKPLLGLFRLAMSPRSTSHRPRHIQRAYEMSYHHWGEFETHAFHVVACMGPTTSIVNLHGRKNQL